MKKISIAAVSLLIMSTALFLSCSKSSTSPKATPTPINITGYWFGSAYGGEFNQSYLLESNGTLKVYDFYYYPTSTDTSLALDGTGNYSVSGNSVKVNTSFSNGENFSLTGIIDTAVKPETITFTSGNEVDVYTKQN